MFVCFSSVKVIQSFPLSEIPFSLGIVMIRKLLRRGESALTSHVDCNFVLNNEKTVCFDYALFFFPLHELVVSGNYTCKCFHAFLLDRKGQYKFSVRAIGWTVFNSELMLGCVLYSIYQLIWKQVKSQSRK